MATSVEEDLRVDRSRHWTLDDLWDLPDDGRRREIIDAVLYVSPSARRRHQHVVGKLVRRLGTWADEHGGQVYPGVNVDLSDGSHLEPDVAFLRPGREVTADVLGLEHAPDLVVEVSSPSTRRFDLGLKRERYARYGVGEFWFVDLDDDVILVFTGGSGDPARHGRGTTMTPPFAPGLVLEVDDLLD